MASLKAGVQQLQHSWTMILPLSALLWGVDRGLFMVKSRVSSDEALLLSGAGIVFQVLVFTLLTVLAVEVALGGRSVRRAVAAFGREFFYLLWTVIYTGLAMWPWAFLGFLALFVPLMIVKVDPRGPIALVACALIVCFGMMGAMPAWLKSQHASAFALTGVRAWLERPKIIVPWRERFLLALPTAAVTLLMVWLNHAGWLGVAISAVIGAVVTQIQVLAVADLAVRPYVSDAIPLETLEAN